MSESEFLSMDPHLVSSIPVWLMGNEAENFDSLRGLRDIPRKISNSLGSYAFLCVCMRLSRMAQMQ